jgi:hypothetical protein
MTLKKAIERIEFRLNNTYNRSLNAIPNEVCFGKCELLKEYVEIPNYKKLYEEMIKCKKKDLEKVNKTRICNKEYKEGSNVMISTRSTNKLENVWEGPFKVEKTKGNKVLIQKGDVKEWYNLRNVRLLGDG